MKVEPNVLETTGDRRFQLRRPADERCCDCLYGHDNKRCINPVKFNITCHELGGAFFLVCGGHLIHAVEALLAQWSDTDVVVAGV